MDLIFLEGMRDFVTEVLMQFLEIYSNLISSVQHNGFEGHFEFGVKTLVSKERCNHGHQVQGVIANSARGRRLNQLSWW